LIHVFRLKKKKALYRVYLQDIGIVTRTQEQGDAANIAYVISAGSIQSDKPYMEGRIKSVITIVI